MRQAAHSEAQTDPRLDRLTAALAAVLPASTTFAVSKATAPGAASIEIGVHSLFARWIGRGSVHAVREALSLQPQAAILVASEMSLAARAAAARSGVGWVDESGAAEIAVAGIVVSRTGERRAKTSRAMGWTPVVLSVAEALLYGTEATVSATSASTGHSMSAVARALAFLTSLGLLEASAARGRLAGRRIVDAREMIDSYADAANDLLPDSQLRCGLLWSQPLAELQKVGRRWQESGVRWAATGAMAADLLAPHLAELAAAEIYVDAATAPALLNKARQGGLTPLEGGRLLLRPFPTAASLRLASMVADIRIAPWPRVYADLRRVGVRGEEAAEHLLETIGA